MNTLFTNGEINWVACWDKIETGGRDRIALHGAIGEANSDARFRGVAEDDTESPEWCKKAVTAYDDIAGCAWDRTRDGRLRRTTRGASNDQA